jgi:hypothetical protein
MDEVEAFVRAGGSVEPLRTGGAMAALAAGSGEHLAGSSGCKVADRYA